MRASPALSDQRPAIDYLQAARKLHTQSEIAAMLGVNIRTVRRWEVRQCDPPESATWRTRRSFSIFSATESSRRAICWNRHSAHDNPSASAGWCCRNPCKALVVPPALKRCGHVWSACPCLRHPTSTTANVAAALTYARPRWQGVAIHSTADCLIAQIAIEHKFTLLHDDDDFVKNAGVEPRLKVASGGQQNGLRRGRLYR